MPLVHDRSISPRTKYYNTHLL